MLWPHQKYFIFPPLTHGQLDMAVTQSFFDRFRDFLAFSKSCKIFEKNGKIRFFVTIIFWHF